MILIVNNNFYVSFPTKWNIYFQKKRILYQEICLYWEDKIWAIAPLPKVWQQESEYLDVAVVKEARVPQIMVSASTRMEEMMVYGGGGEEDN